MNKTYKKQIKDGHKENINPNNDYDGLSSNSLYIEPRKLNKRSYSVNCIETSEEDEPTRTYSFSTSFLDSQCSEEPFFALSPALNKHSTSSTAHCSTEAQLECFMSQNLRNF